MYIASQLSSLNREHPITNKGILDMKNLSLSLLMAASMSCSALASAADVKAAKPTVVLVHGAFSDGSTWNKVIPLLEAKGINVVAVQNPLTSFAESSLGCVQTHPTLCDTIFALDCHMGSDLEFIHFPCRSYCS